jgi:hypothetical protein
MDEIEHFISATKVASRQIIFYLFVCFDSFWYILMLKNTDVVSRNRNTSEFTPYSLLNGAMILIKSP